MKCKIFHSDLIFYIDGDLPEARSKAIESHLKDCPECSAQYEYLKASLDVINTENDIEANPFFYTRVSERLRNLDARKDQKVIMPVYARVLQPAIFVVLLVIGTYTGISLGNVFEPEQEAANSASHTVEYYFNDFQQEKLETFLLKD